MFCNDTSWWRGSRQYLRDIACNSSTLCRQNMRHSCADGLFQSKWSLNDPTWHNYSTSQEVNVLLLVVFWLDGHLVCHQMTSLYILWLQLYSLQVVNCFRNKQKEKKTRSVYQYHGQPPPKQKAIRQTTDMIIINHQWFFPMYQCTHKLLTCWYTTYNRVSTLSIHFNKTVTVTALANNPISKEVWSFQNVLFMQELYWLNTNQVKKHR